MYTKPHSFVLPFSHKEQIAKDTFAFYFERTKEDWDFYPGQYIQMMLPIEHPDDRGTMRYFTISSSPLDKQYLRINTKVIQSTFKKTLASLKKGQEVSFYGPSGDFYFQEKEPSHVFLAGGIGINPFISMLEYAAAKKITNQMRLLVSFSDRKDFIHYDQLSQMSNDHPHINIVYTPERISPELIQKYITQLEKPIYYIVGPPPMVEATVTMLEEMKVSENRILQEHFSGY